MKLPPPHRWAYFPPVQIFGRNLVPIYYAGNQPVIPVAEAARVLGLSAGDAFRLAAANREVIALVDGATGEAISPALSLPPERGRLCLGMDGICILIFRLNHQRLADPEARQRVLLARSWLLAQLANRLKLSGRKNQPRWDKGLSREQRAEFKKRFAAIRSRGG